MRAPTLLAAAWLFAAPAAAEPPLAVVGANLVDGTGGPAAADVTILVEGERIAAVGPGTEVSVPPDATVIDGRGKWVIPGLIDAHVHFFQSGGLYTRPDIIDLRRIRPYEEEIARIRDRLPETFARYIASGVTGVVDVGGPIWTFEVRALARRTGTAPRVAATGPLLGTIAPPEMSALRDPPIIDIGSPDQARDTVRRLLARRPDLVKIWFVPNGSLAADMAWVRAAIAESHAAGVPVVAHATRLRIAKAMVEAGVDVLAHSVADTPMGDDLLKEMARRGVAYVTTLVVDEGYREVLGGQVRLSAIERRLGDPEVIATWNELPRPMPWGRPALGEAEAENLRRAVRQGVTLAAGSDAGNIGTLHGPALHRELELMVAAGITPMQALVAATRGGAAVMGRAAELGTVEPGKLADLVILDADPLADIRNTRRIHRVIKGGRDFDPAEVSARLDR